MTATLDDLLEELRAIRAALETDRPGRRRQPSKRTPRLVAPAAPTDEVAAARADAALKRLGYRRPS